MTNNLQETIPMRDDAPEISICMVSLNCWDVIQDCLDSLRRLDPPVTHEVIVVDNGSTDGTPAKLRESYPEARLVENGANVGFTKGTNQGIALSRGKYLLWLNTDTILRPDSLHKLHRFMEASPKIGIAGPKVLNPDGSFQPQCKRGIPTPMASLCYMLKLDRIWPRSRTAGQYLLTYLPDDQPNPVDAVSGCCLMARREVWERIGPLDESIFAFGEDIDWCVRAGQAGFEVWFCPESVITHLKGKGGVHVRPYHKIRGMHEGMWIFYQRHLRARYTWPVTALVWLGIRMSYCLSCSATWLRRAIPRPARE